MNERPIFYPPWKAIFIALAVVGFLTFVVIAAYQQGVHSRTRVHNTR